MGQQDKGRFLCSESGPERLVDMAHVLEESVMDSLKLIPFLFLAYLAMEFLEHRAGERAGRMIRSAGSWGPVAGALMGILPQCGFSAAASNFYAGRVITLGTLIAVYLSTSDEMLPILLAQGAPGGLVAGILLLKAGVGMASGLLIDFVMKRNGGEQRGSIGDICAREHCSCEKGIFRSALRHTLKIAFFLFAVTLALNLALHFGGEDVLAGMLLNRPVAGPLLAGLVGLIPNCAGSVVITRLYLEGAMSLGAAMAGLLAGSGVGLLVLFRVNGDRRENLRILGLLYGIGVGAGIVTGFFAA